MPLSLVVVDECGEQKIDRIKVQQTARTKQAENWRSNSENHGWQVTNCCVIERNHNLEFPLKAVYSLSVF